MPLSPEDLPGKLRGTPAPAWLVCGEEPLRVLECGDAIRRAAIESGCSEREVFHVESGFDWNRLRESGGSLSLFGDRRLVEVRLDRVPAKSGQEALEAWCNDPPPDTVLLVFAGTLDKKQLGADWVRAIERAGAVVVADVIPRAALPAWIAQRLKKHGLTADGDALALLADRIEGNLLAAQQEIDRIALLFGSGHLGIDALREVIADHARYDVDGLLAAALAGDAARALHMLGRLREEGDSPHGLLWPIHRDVRWLLLASEARAAGQGESAALSAAGAWGGNTSRLLPALRRLKTGSLRALLADCAKAEKINKGQAPGDSWDVLATLLLRLAGRPAPMGTGRDIA